MSFRMRCIGNKQSLTCPNMVFPGSGGQTNSQFLASCESYSVVTNSWRPLCDLPLPIHGAAAAFLDGALYIAGGKSMRQYEEKLWVSTLSGRQSQEHVSHLTCSRTAFCYHLSLSCHLLLPFYQCCKQKAVLYTESVLTYHLAII